MRARIAAVAALLSGATSLVALPGRAAAASRPKTHMPATPVLGFPESWGLSHRDVIDIAAGLVIVVLLAVILILRVRRRRGQVVRAPETRTQAFPTTAEAWRGSGLAEEPTGRLPKFEASSVVLPPLAVTPGWHPVQGDATRLAYWDGGSWTAFRQWDGHAWVDPTVVPS